MKTWHEELQKHIEYWAERLTPSKLEWWPRCVFHSTDLSNAISIFATGNLYSRQMATELGLMVNDNASQQVIRNTPNDHKSYARMYFRPKTPTHYLSEGFRPKQELVKDEYHAHCPMPIFFLFNAYEVLAAVSTEFSDGNMARHRVVFGKTQKVFNSIPFEQVFHSGGYDKESFLNQDITFHRQAEVLVPEHLPIVPSLKRVYCRSGAERQTLLYNLNPEVRANWESKIKICRFPQLFERKATYVESVKIIGESLGFVFNPDSKCPGPFEARLEYREIGTKRVRAWSGRWEDVFIDAHPIDIRGAKRGVAKLLLDGNLAYQGVVNFESLPT